MSKRKEITWFKVSGDVAAIIQDMDDESIGRAFYNAVKFFYTFQGKKTFLESRLNEDDIEGHVLFKVLRNYIMETITHYNEIVENRSRAAKDRVKKDLQKKIEQEQEEGRMEAERRPPAPDPPEGFFDIPE